MNEQQKNKIIDRLQKIKALADEGAEGEAENAAKLLGKMLAKHRMSMEDLKVTDPDEIIRQRIENMGDRSWIRTLYGKVARYFDCRFAFRKRGGDCTLVGYSEDIECAKYLFVVAKRQIEASTVAAKARGEIFGKSEYHNYRMSMVWGFDSKLREIKAEVSTDNPGYGIVLRDRGQRVSDWVDENCSWGSGSRTRYRRNQSAYDRGREIRISTGIKGENAKRITGQLRLPGS